MHSDLVDIGWTEEQWNRILTAVTEEAQRARVAAQMLPVVGPEQPSTVAVPPFTLHSERSPQQVPARTAPRRLYVDSDPTLPLTRISVNVQVHMREAADPTLAAALTMFRRAANYVARIEDALVFNGRPGPGLPPPYGVGGIPAVYQVNGDGAPEGIFPFLGSPGQRTYVSVASAPVTGLPPGVPPSTGDRVVTAIVRAINALDANGQLGPYACALSSHLFEAVCTPNANLVLPRDRILPLLQGPLLRSSSISPPFGAVIALSASPIELVVASDLDVRFLQTSEESRLIFSVAEKVALRIKEDAAIAVLH
jgi:uncharacterized linocin/CFP29 family protein